MNFLEKMDENKRKTPRCLEKIKASVEYEDRVGVQSIAKDIAKEHPNLMKIKGQ